MPEPSEQLNVRVSPGINHALHQQARAEKTTKSALVNRLISNYLNTCRDDQAHRDEKVFD